MRRRKGGRAGRPGLVLAATCLLLNACGASGRPSAAPSSVPQKSGHFGGYPAFLPKQSLNLSSDQPLRGTLGNPAVTVQGDPVVVDDAGWTATVEVSGPQVPGEGLPYQTPATTCTWTVTLSSTKGRVPVAISAFTSLDSLGEVYHPYLVPGSPAPPAFIGPGQKTTLELRVVEKIGEGLMRWAPVSDAIVAKWDFIVEND